jgi:hypothetical protein
MFTKPKRVINRVFIHCSDSEDANLKGDALYNAVYKWHVEERGWKDIGYHYLIDKEGKFIFARNLAVMPAAQRGHNLRSVAIMVHGRRKFTDESLGMLLSLCARINEKLEGRVSFHGHCEVNENKLCPVFNYSNVLRLDRFGRMY